MVSPRHVGLLPVSLILFLLSSHVLAASPTSPNDLFRAIAIHVPKAPEQPICCLKPLPPVEPEKDDELLLSFEEWKAKHIGVKDVGASGAHPAAGTTSSNGGTGQAEPVLEPPQPPSSTTALPDAAPAHSHLSPHFRVPLTDRFNFANLDCSARVHTAHRGAKSPSAILSAKKDRYMLSPCGARAQHVVVELCDDVRIDTVQLANFEFFSGVFKDFNVSVAKTYTTDSEGWIPAGTYRAKNVRGVQSFHPPTTLRDFYRYIRVDFLSHYGSEYYCPVSLLRVYGLTQLEEWKWGLWEEESLAKREVSGEDPSPVVAEPPSEAPSPILAPSTEAIPTSEPEVSQILTSDEASSATPITNSAQMPLTDNVVSSQSDPTTELPSSPSGAQAKSVAVPLPFSTSSNDAIVATKVVEATPGASAAAMTRKEQVVEQVSTAFVPLVADTSTENYYGVPSSPHLASVPELTTQPAASVHLDILPPSPSIVPEMKTGTDAVSSPSPANHTMTTTTPASVATVAALTVTSLAHAPSPVPAPPVLPAPLAAAGNGGGESIYRTIMNRIAALEANTTLYARYVEEQMAGVREVMRRVGEDVGRLEGITKAQAQTLQRSVNEMERQRKRIEVEHSELLSRMDYLTDEVMLEKRLGIAQLCLLLAVLVFMGLTRGSRGESVISIDYARSSSALGRGSAMREWGRRNLSFNGDWVSRLRTGSLTSLHGDARAPKAKSDDGHDDRPLFPSRKSSSGASGENGAVPSREYRQPPVSRAPVSSALRTPARPHTAAQPRAGPSSHAHAQASLEPRGALQRSLSQGTPSAARSFSQIGPVPRSAKRWARTAHLHEVVRSRSREKGIPASRKGKERERDRDGSMPDGGHVAWPQVSATRRIRDSEDGEDGANERTGSSERENGSVVAFNSGTRSFKEKGVANGVNGASGGGLRDRRPLTPLQIFTTHSPEIIAINAGMSKEGVDGSAEADAWVDTDVDASDDEGRVDGRELDGSRPFVQRYHQSVAE